MTCRWPILVRELLLANIPIKEIGIPLTLATFFMGLVAYVNGTRSKLWGHVNIERNIVAHFAHMFARVFSDYLMCCCCGGSGVVVVFLPHVLNLKIKSKKKEKRDDNTLGMPH